MGGTRPIPVDVRVICATNRSLEAEVAEKRFRADLFYRLKVFPIHVPPLRERREDVPLLVDAFVRALGSQLGRALEGVDETALLLLCSYHWPGNVRELHNVLERAAMPRARSPHRTRKDAARSPLLPRSQARLPDSRGAQGAGRFVSSDRSSRKRSDTPRGTSPRPLGSFTSAAPPWRTR